MKLKIIAVFTALLCTTSLVQAEITLAPTLAPFEEALEHLQEGSLVVFDVDDVLITCTDPTLQELNKSRLENVCNAMAQKVSFEEYVRLYSIAMKSREIEVIDQRIFDLLHDLSERNIHAIALTHMRTGRFGVIEKMEDWRVLELDKLGIDFKKMSPFSSERTLEDLKGPSGTLPNIKDGVIFTAEIEKGKVLAEAFKFLPRKPSKVIFIDDRMDNLESVEKLCEEQGIIFQGFQYTAAQSKFRYIDEKLIEIQVDTLMKEGRWITSEEAAESFNDEHL